MPKSNHTTTLEDRWWNEIMQQIWTNFQTTGNFDPYSAKMPDTSVKFKHIFEELDEDTIIYRFFPFERFENLIQEKRLPYISPLCYTNDEKEAECFDEYKIYIYRYLKYLHINKLLSFEDTGIKQTGELEIDLMNISSRWERIFQYCRRNIFVSCWTLNKPNNAYMWEQYTQNSPDAVCIQTSIKDFKNAVTKTGHGDHYIDKIRYIDWQNQSIDAENEQYIKTLDNLRYSLFHKQEKFQKDNEIRIVIDNLTCNTTAWAISNTNTILGHKDFDYDQYFEDKSRPTKFLKEQIILENLINKIILSPFAKKDDELKIKQLLSENNLSSEKITRAT